MSHDLANKEAAEDCKSRGVALLEAGQYEKAIKFLEKSRRLFPLSGVDGLIEVATRKLKGGDSNKQGGASQRSNGTNGMDGSSTSSSGRGEGGVAKQEVLVLTVLIQLSRK